MSTKHTRISVIVTERESKSLLRECRNGETLPALIRRKLNLVPLKQGPPKGNKNAAKK